MIETIDKTIQHLNGTKKIKSKEMFAGFTVGAGDDRIGEQIKLDGDPNDCKVSSKDTDGAMCIFEFTGGGGGLIHVDQPAGRRKSSSARLASQRICHRASR